MQIRRDIVFKHAEDAAFVWTLRESSLRHGGDNQRSRLALDLRLDAHLDGLTLAGEAGFAACLDLLETFGSPAELFAAAAVALGLNNPSFLDGLLEYTGRSKAHQRALVSAFGVQMFEHVEHMLREWLISKDPARISLALAAYAVHVRDPGAMLNAALEHSEHVVVQRAVRLAGVLGRTDTAGRLRQYRTVEIETEVALALALLHQADSETRARLETAVFDPARAASVFARLVELAPQQASARILDWQERGDAANAIKAIAVLGDVGHVPSLIRWMDNPIHARRAGEAFARITGLDLSLFGLERQDPPENPDDPDTELPVFDPDAALRWPSSVAAARCFAAHSDRFDRNLRYLEGVAVGQTRGVRNAQHLRDLIRIAQQGSSHSRRAAAEQLAMAWPTAPRIETRALACTSHVIPGLTALSDLLQSASEHRAFIE
jgi:uncharacterized protein (TIGR02270 family)